MPRLWTGVAMNSRKPRPKGVTSTHMHNLRWPCCLVVASPRLIGSGCWAVKRRWPLPRRKANMLSPKSSSAPAGAEKTSGAPGPFTHTSASGALLRACTTVTCMHTHTHMHAPLAWLNKFIVTMAKESKNKFFAFLPSWYPSRLQPWPASIHAFEHMHTHMHTHVHTHMHA